jgi:hypothetical protein
MVSVVKDGGFGSDIRGFGFGDDFLSTVSGFGTPKPIGFVSYLVF